MDEGQPHQWQTRRTYQFPNATKVIHVGACHSWIVNTVQSSKEHYGVIRYVVDRDRVAWLESDAFVGENSTAAAEQWVRATIARLPVEALQEGVPRKRELMPQENQSSNLAAWLEAKQQLQERLKAAGITEADYNELFGLLDVVTGTDLESVRAKQFEEDARELLLDLKVAQEKNVLRASAFLRQFAEHIARHLSEDGVLEETIDARVDALPTLTSWLEK